MASYKEIRQMWSDVGMDLEAHDTFVQAFPEILRKVILSQENRPKRMDYFTDVVKRLHGMRPYELFEHKQRGGKVVGTYCVYVPDEVVFALGAVSTGLCGGDQFWVPGGDRVLPPNTCALVKSSLGSRLDRTSPFCQVTDLYVGETTCDGKKKAWEILSEDVPMHIMDVPQMKRETDVRRFAGEIRLLIRKLEDLTGLRMSAERLSRGIRLINEKRMALQRLYAARRASPPPISGRDALMITQIAFYDDPERFALKLNELCDELEERIRQKEGVCPQESPRVMIAGTPMAMPFWKVPFLVETLGAVVVVEELCTGTRYFEHLVEDGVGNLEAQIQSIAERYMKTNCACFTPNAARVEDILRMVEEYHVDGVIDYRLQFCGLYATEGYFIKEALKERGIPLLQIETDYSEQDAEQLRTRIEAFLEILRAR